MQMRRRGGPLLGSGRPAVLSLTWLTITSATSRLVQWVKNGPASPGSVAISPGDAGMVLEVMTSRGAFVKKGDTLLG